MMLPPIQGVNHHQAPAVILKYIKIHQYYYQKFKKKLFEVLNGVCLYHPDCVTIIG